MSNQSGSWTPASLGSALKTFVRADSVKGRTAAQFTRANSESLSKAAFSAVQPGTGDFSVECWCLFDALASGTIYSLFGAGAGGVSPGYWVFVSGEAGSATGLLRCEIQDAGGSTARAAAAGGITAVSLYHHIVVTFDRDGNATFYINGSVSGTPATIATRSGSVDAFATFYLGALAGGSPHGGRIQAARVYKNTLLSGAQVTALYNGGVGLMYDGIGATLQAACSGAAWDLKEESGTRADATGGGNTLTDNNTVTANDGKVAYAVTADASVVAIGTDQGAAALVIQQAVHASKPLLKTAIINGQPVLRFDGTDDFLKVATGAISNQPLWGWAVVDDNDAATRYYLDGGAASKVALRHDGTNLEVNAGADVGAAHAAGAPHLVTFSVNGASSEIWVDGTSLATGDAGAQNQDSGIAIGADNAGASPLAGDIAEIAIVAGSPTAADLANLKTYITARYGLTIA
jgi:hypothetical protein